MSEVKRSVKRARMGFTLIELLVVIAIIAILAAILFPVFAQAREAARKTTCSSNLRQLATAMTMYRSDYDQAFPMGGWYDVAGASGSDWHNTVMPYVKNKGLFRCPSSTDIHNDNDERYDWNRTATDYLFNNNINEGRAGRSESILTAPADTVMLIEGHSDWGDGGHNCQPAWSNVPLTNNYWCVEYTFFGNQSKLITGTWDGAVHVWGLTRHNRGATAAFADGHVKFINGLDVKTNSAESIQKIEAALPWRKNIDPDQNSGAWGG